MDVKDLNPKGHLIADTLLNNLEDLSEKMTALEKNCPYEFVVTCGYRTEEEQLKINPKNPRSNHTLGCAVDIWDPDSHIWEWVQDNTSLLVKFGIWVENPNSDLDGHLHLQTLPPKSGNRFFWP